MNIETFIIDVLKNTVEALHIAYKCNKEAENKGFCPSCKLVFPKKRDNSTRISEQELRFEFINQLLKEDKENQYWYSIEAPTFEKYLFKWKKPKKSKIGKSGSFDLVLFDSEGDRIALIEFKANNPDAANYWKDFVKMNTEGKNIPCYLIELLKAKDDDTDESIENKFKTDVEDRCINNINYYCIVLEENKIYMYNAKEQQFKEL